MEVVEGVMKNNSSSGRTAVALQLARDRDPLTEALLLASLKDKDWSVRAAAVSAIGIRGNSSLRQHLEPLLEDEKSAVRLRAAAAYLRLSELSTSSKKPAKAH